MAPCPTRNEMTPLATASVVSTPNSGISAIVIDR